MTRSTSAARRSGASGASARVGVVVEHAGERVEGQCRLALALGLGDHPAQPTIGVTGDGDGEHLRGDGVESGVVGDRGERGGVGEVAAQGGPGCGQVTIEGGQLAGVGGAVAVVEAGEAHDRGAGELEPGRGGRPPAVPDGAPVAVQALAGEPNWRSPASPRPGTMKACSLRCSSTAAV